MSRSPEFAIARLTTRRAIRAATGWGVVFAVYIAASALGYAAAYSTVEQRHALAASLGQNAGIDALFGPARGIDTVAGFTAWRSLGVLSLVGAVWGLLTATRLLRGEEESGRWELLLAGRTTRRRASAEALVGLGAGFTVLWAIPAAVTVSIGARGSVRLPVGGSLLLVTASMASAATFLLVGALTSQLAATRRQAATFAGVALGLAYALRAVADSGVGLRWLRWLTPLGWSELVRPLGDENPAALLPWAGLLAALTILTITLAGRRDLAASLLPDRTGARPATRLLSSATGLTARLTRPLLLGWLTATGLAGLLFGLVSDSAGRTLQSAGGLQQALERLGARGFGARAYLGVAFLILAVLVALATSAAISALRAEESIGRLDHLLARPLSRSRWLAGRVGAGLALIVGCAAAASTGAWVGAASQGAKVGASDLFQAAANAAAPAVLVLGVGTFAFGVRPRAATAICYGLVAWSFLVQLLGSVVGLNRWVLDTSMFRHLRGAPAVPPNWTAVVVLSSAGAAAAVAGVLAFTRRDLAGE